MNQSEWLLFVPDKYDDSSFAFFGSTTMPGGPDSSAENEVSLNKSYSHDTITSLKGTYKCQADTITVAECPLYEVVNKKL